MPTRTRARRNVVLTAKGKRLEDIEAYFQNRVDRRGASA
jgi:hypothetical protein